MARVFCRECGDITPRTYEVFLISGALLAFTVGVWSGISVERSRRGIDIVHVKKCVHLDEAIYCKENK